MLLVIALIASAPLCLLYSGIVAVNKPSYFKRVLPLYIYGIAIIAYCCMPNYENDLIRYFAYIERTISVPIENAYNWNNDGLILKDVTFWVIGRIGDVHLLPALSTATLYGVAAYISADTMRGSRRLWIVLMFQIMTIPFLESVSNVRNVAAFALIILAVYRDAIQHKRNVVTIALYVLPCFIHMSGVVLVIFRLAALLARRHPVLALSATIAIPSLTIAAYGAFYSAVRGIPGSVGLIASRALNKAYTATMGDSSYALAIKESGYANACQYIMFAIAIIMAVLLIERLWQNRKQGIDTDYYSFFLIILGVTAVWSILHIVKYWVFAVALVTACPPAIKLVLQKSAKLKLWNQFGLLALALLGIARAVLEIYYMSSRLDLPDLLITVFGTNLFTIIGNLFLV